MLYNTTPATAAPAITLIGLGFHLRRTKKPARKITSAIKVMAGAAVAGVVLYSITA